MKKRMIATIAIIIMALGLMTGCGSENETLTIGISQFADHPSLDNCREGFLAGLAEAGYVEGENLTIIYQNAQTDMGTASTIAAGFVSQKVDLICGIATPSAMADRKSVV